MTDDPTPPELRAVFSELERQADSVGARRADEPRLSHAPRGGRPGILLVAASIVAVLALAGGLAIAFGRSDDRPDGNGGRQQAGGPVLTRSGSFAPEPSSMPSATGSNAPTSALPSSSNPPPPPHGSGSSVPQNAKQMEAALRRVLGSTATFTVSQRHGNYIVGVLTNTRTGAQGGFDIQAEDGPGNATLCEDPGPQSHCTTSKTRDGGAVVRERETYGNDKLYFVNYVNPEGAAFLMHVSNREDPKGAGTTYGVKPPLTLAQMVAILESPKWYDS